MEIPQDIVNVVGIPGFREPVSSILHLLGAAAALGFSPLLAKRAKLHGCRKSTLFTIWLFSFACVLLLSLSGVYHMFAPGGTPRAVMKRLDIAAIFVLIAGTCTPLYFLVFRGFARWFLLLSIWAVAIAGLTLRIVFFDQISPWFNLGIFLAMGWMAAGAAYIVWKRYGFAYLRKLVYGGIAYTLGAVCLGTAWPVIIPGVVESHEVWHVAVLIGIACHWAFIWQVAGGPPVPGHDWSTVRQVAWED